MKSKLIKQTHSLHLHPFCLSVLPVSSSSSSSSYCSSSSLLGGSKTQTAPLRGHHNLPSLLSSLLSVYSHDVYFTCCISSFLLLVPLWFSNSVWSKSLLMRVFMEVNEINVGVPSRACMCVLAVWWMLCCEHTEHDMVVNSNFSGYTVVLWLCVHARSVICLCLCVRVCWRANRQLPAAYKQALRGKPIWVLKWLRPRK